jgi:hypothetical protein
MPVINSKGQMALRWTINTNGKTVRIGSSDKYYVFVPKQNVVMAWVDSEDVMRLLAVREKSCNCNNGTFKNAFEPCSLINVNLWMFNDRNGSLSSDYKESE